MNNRQGISLLELIIVLAILAVMLGLLLPGIQKVRETAYKMQSMNNVKQITLAMHSYASQNNNNLPYFTWVYPKNVFIAILPHIDSGKDIDISRYQDLAFKLYTSPADPTLWRNSFNHGFETEEPDPDDQPVTHQFRRISYGANAYCFTNSPNMLTRITDGTSNTIAFAEHYSVCATVTYNFQDYTNHANLRRSSFADVDRSIFKAMGKVRKSKYIDVLPVTSGNPPVTRASVPGKTFQSKPRFIDCDDSTPQTPHANGMIIGLFDGSVRTVRVGVDESVFWSAVTPAGGETLPLD